VRRLLGSSTRGGKAHVRDRTWDGKPGSWCTGRRVFLEFVHFRIMDYVPVQLY
jgi:hypothetical protein